MLREEAIPSVVSENAGCFVCNAVFYWSLYFADQNSSPTQSAFIHIPLATGQVLNSLEHLPSLDTEVCANALETIMRDLAR
jgi:pyroglutamyl-peptidase